jgi:hypothetical protein
MTKSYIFAAYPSRLPDQNARIRETSVVLSETGAVALLNCYAGQQ